MFKLNEETGPETALYGWLVRKGGIPPYLAEAALWDYKRQSQGITIKIAAEEVGKSRQGMINALHLSRRAVNRLDIPRCKDCIHCESCKAAFYPPILSVICENYTEAR